eukprot:485366_1
MEGVELPPGYTSSPGVAGQGNDAQQEKEVEEQRSMILDQIMTLEARERLNHIKLVKKEKARNLEDMLIQSARMGRLSQRVSEDQFVQMLESVKEQFEKRTKVTIQRRKCFGEEDDDDGDDDLLM